MFNNLIIKENEKEFTNGYYCGNGNELLLKK